MGEVLHLPSWSAVSEVRKKNILVLENVGTLGTILSSLKWHKHGPVHICQRNGASLGLEIWDSRACFDWIDN